MLFGNIVITPTFIDAKKIAFDPQMNYQCFTFDGVEVDPRGVVSGGQKIKKYDFITFYIKYKQLSPVDYTT